MPLFPLRADAFCGKRPPETEIFNVIYSFFYLKHTVYGTILYISFQKRGKRFRLPLRFKI